MTNYSVAEFQDSLKWFSRAQKSYTELGLLRKQSMVHLNTGIAYYKIGDYPSAFDSLLKSHEIGVQGDWVHRQCFSNIALGNVYRLTHDFQQARQHLHTAYNQAQELGFPREEALALEFLGDVYRDEDQPAQARRFYNRAMAIGRKIAPEGDIVMEVHRRLGECLSREGDVASARVELERSLQLAKTQGDRFEEGVILRVIGEIGLAGGELGAARTAGERAIGLLRQIGARHELAIALLRAAELALAELERDAQPDQPLALLGQAWDLATQALDLFLQIDVDEWTLQTRGTLKRISQQREAHEQAANQALTASGEDGKTGQVGYRAKDVIIHTSSRMRELLQLCDMFAASDEPVLVTGETGTGKELIARRIHAHSGRSSGNLVTVNVAAIPQTLFEREFFGHVRGAFSGADRDGLGFAAQADGGTLFLDEIGDLPLEAQPKLLRLLQEGAYQALGDPVERRANIRLIAATNANLGRLVREGKFRSDLYYRLKILELDLPPVRERVEDVQPLLRHFLSLVAGRPVGPAEFFNDTSLKLAEQHDWPGNVREIAMVARQAKIQLETTGRVEIELNQAAGTQLVLSGPRQPRQHAVAVFDRMDRLADFKGRLSNRLEQKLVRDRTRIELALAESDGNCTRAARLLGISRSTLYRKLKQLGISRRTTS